MKLYWRYKKDGKWSWKAARSMKYETPDGYVGSFVFTPVLYPRKEEEE